MPSDKVRAIVLTDFPLGYVYTQMVWTASKCLGPLQEFDLELSVLEDLLSQRFWSRGKRGKWYERRVIVRNHMKKKHNGDKVGLYNHQLATIEGLKAALSDSDTGLGEFFPTSANTVASVDKLIFFAVYRPGFVTRLLALEKRLNIPETLRTQCTAQLKEPTRVEFSGKKLETRVDKFGNPIQEKENTPGLRSYFNQKNADAMDLAMKVDAVSRAAGIEAVLRAQHAVGTDTQGHGQVPVGRQGWQHSQRRDSRDRILREERVQRVCILPPGPRISGGSD